MLSSNMLPPNLIPLIVVTFSTPTRFNVNYGGAASFSGYIDSAWRSMTEGWCGDEHLILFDEAEVVAAQVGFDAHSFS